MYTTSDNNYLIESDSVAFGRMEEAIRRLVLDGLDVRITPVSRNKALLPRHVLEAIRLQYNIDPWYYLSANGVKFDAAYPISDQDALTLYMHRSVAELDPRPEKSIAPVSGVQWHLNAIAAPAAWAPLGGADNIAWSCKRRRTRRWPLGRRRG